MPRLQPHARAKGNPKAVLVSSADIQLALGMFIPYFNFPMNQGKKNLKGLSLAELQDFVESLDEKKYRAGKSSPGSTANPNGAGGCNPSSR